MPECLDSFPWHSIKGCGNMAPHMFGLGDYKNEVLKDGTPVQFRIIGFNQDNKQDGSILPVTFELVDCLPNRYPMNRNDTTEGSWGGSYLFRELNNLGGSIYKNLPDEIIELAEPVVKLTADTYSGNNNIVESVGKFFILSEKERFGRCFYSVPGEGHWYEWYRQEDVPWFKLRNGSPEYLWERSPYSSASALFCRVSGGGSASRSDASTAFGVSFGFSF